MTLDQSELLEEAASSIKAARMLLRTGYPGYAASRAYYAMFHIAQAFLEGEGLAFSKHSAVIAAFGKEFARTGRVPVEFHRFLIEAQEARLDADYGGPKVDLRQAEELIDNAERFLAIAQEQIGPLPPEN